VYLTDIPKFFTTSLLCNLQTSLLVLLFCKFGLISLHNIIFYDHYKIQTETDQLCGECLYELLELGQQGGQQVLPLFILALQTGEDERQERLVAQQGLAETKTNR